MKKQILALSIGLISVGAMAQKAELKALDKAVDKGQFDQAVAASKAAEALLGNMDEKQKAKFYFLKGQAFAGKKDFKTAAEAYNTLMKHEKSIGRSKYTKQAVQPLNQLKNEAQQRAFDLYEAKNFKGASEAFYTRYLLDTKDTMFLSNAAQIALQDKNYDEALKYYKDLKDVGYTGIETQYVATNKETGQVENLGSIKKRDLMVKTGQYIKPETKVTKSKKSNIVKNIALILREQGKTDEAIVAFKEARAEDPKDLQLLLGEAFLYNDLKQADKFQALMEEATKLDPNNPDLFYNLGVVNQNDNKMQEAEKNYRKAIELKPDYRDAYINLAGAILSKEEAIVEEMNKNLSNFKKYDELEAKKKEVYKEALPFLEKADSLERTIETVKTLMNIYEVLGDNAKASEFGALYRSMK